MNKKVTINNEIRDFVKRALEAFKGGYEGTYFYKLGYSEFHDGIWAIAIGWSDGFDPNDTDGISDGNGFKVCAKLAYSDGYMQSDYDMDWIMPYDEETGDVDDTDSAISANPEDALDYVAWLLKRWNEDYANYVADEEIFDSRKVKDSADAWTAWVYNDVYRVPVNPDFDWDSVDEDSVSPEDYTWEVNNQYPFEEPLYIEYDMSDEELVTYLIEMGCLEGYTPDDLYIDWTDGDMIIIEQAADGMPVCYIQKDY